MSAFFSQKLRFFLHKLWKPFLKFYKGDVNYLISLNKKKKFHTLNALNVDFTHTSDRVNKNHMQNIFSLKILPKKFHNFTCYNENN